MTMHIYILCIWQRPTMIFLSHISYLNYDNCTHIEHNVVTIPVRMKYSSAYTLYTVYGIISDEATQFRIIDTQFIHTIYGTYGFSWNAEKKTQSATHFQINGSNGVVVWLVVNKNSKHTVDAPVHYSSHPLTHWITFRNNCQTPFGMYIIVCVCVCVVYCRV